MFFEYVFRATDGMGIEHEHALVSYRLRIFQDTVQTSRSTFHACRERARTNGSGIDGHNALGLWVRGRDAGFELYVEARRTRADILEPVETRALGIGTMFFWGGVRCSIEATGNH